MFTVRSLRSSFCFRLPTRAATLVAASLLTAAVQSPASAQVFTPLGDLPGGLTQSHAFGVSADGAVVTGSAEVGVGREAFRWTAQTGMVGLGALPGGALYNVGYAVSADGAVIAGTGASASYEPEAFRWTGATGTVTLDPWGYDPPGFRSEAFGISSNGSVVVGGASQYGNAGAYRQTVGALRVYLGDLAGGATNSIAYSVSGDGAVVVGYSGSANGAEAFRWTQSTGMVGLGDLAGGAFSSVAADISSDGLVIVGRGKSASGDQAFRWTQAGGMVGLGDLAGGAFFSAANATSSDGAVVVGVSEGASGLEAFRWTQATGMVSLKRYLIENYPSGVPADFPAWRLDYATGVSADGLVIVGTGVDPAGNTQAWRVRLPSTLPSLWTPVDVAVNRTDDMTRLLWRHASGQYAVWKLSATGALQASQTCGPLLNYTCGQIAVGPSGQTLLLWKNPSARQIALWTLSADLSSVIRMTTYAYPANHTPQSVAADQKDNPRVSWQVSGGSLTLWTITAKSGVVAASATYGPYTNLQGGPLAVGADGNVRVLWDNTRTKAASVWTVPAAYGAPLATHTYSPPATGATARDLAVGADNKARVQWQYATGASAGKITLWKLNTVAGGSGAIEASQSYGPLAYLSPLGLSVGGDNQTRQLWKYDYGAALLWALSDPLTSITATYTYGPLP